MRFKMLFFVCCFNAVAEWMTIVNLIRNVFLRNWIKEKLCK